MLISAALLLASSAAHRYAVDPNDPIARQPDMSAMIGRIVENNVRRGALSTGAEAGLSQADKDDIVALHNKVRAETARGEYTGKDGALPKATNMLKLKWSDALAATASEWASKCRFVHRSQSATTPTIIAMRRSTDTTARTIICPSTSSKRAAGRISRRWA